MPFGLFEFLVMPFGLRNTAQTFQRLINQMLIGLNFVFIYIDDILIVFLSVQEYRQHLKKVFGRLRDHEVSINIDKCKFQAESIEFFGLQISSKESTPLPLLTKVKAIFSCKRPETVQELRRFLETVNFYHRCILNAASTQIPLKEYLKDSKKKDKRPINWTAETIKAFDKIKRDLATLLAHSAPNIKMRLMTDVSGIVMETVLEQTTDRVN